MTPASKLLIKGLSHAGEVFRPSDWAERMCGNLCSFRNRRIYYSPLLRPAIVDGQRCVIVDHELAHAHPQLYSDILSFASENELRTQAWDEN